LLFGLLATLFAGPVLAKHLPSLEPYDAGWSVEIDNDLFTSSERDRDYTGGITVSIAGRRAAEIRGTPNSLRGVLDKQIGLTRFLENESHRTSHVLEFGAALFTPEDITSTTINRQDRPYASLFFISSTQQSILPKRRLSIKSGLTLGVLGLSLAESLQKGIHSAIDSDIPKGWDSQISSGGELTGKYSLAVQRSAFHSIKMGSAKN